MEAVAIRRRRRRGLTHLRGVGGGPVAMISPNALVSVTATVSVTLAVATVSVTLAVAIATLAEVVGTFVADGPAGVMNKGWQQNYMGVECR